MKTKFQQGKIQVYFDGYNIYDFVLLSHYFYTERLPPHPGYYTIENHSISPIEGLEVVNISDFISEVLNGTPMLFDLISKFDALNRKYNDLEREHYELSRAVIRGVGIDFIKNIKHVSRPIPPKNQKGGFF